MKLPPHPLFLLLMLLPLSLSAAPDHLRNGNFSAWASGQPAHWTTSPARAHAQEADFAGDANGSSLALYEQSTISQTLSTPLRDFELRFLFTVNLTPGQSGWRMPLVVRLFQAGDSGTANAWISLRLTGNGETGSFALSIYDKDAAAADKYIKPTGATNLLGSTYVVGQGFGPQAPHVYEMRLNYSSASNRFTVAYREVGQPGWTVLRDLALFNNATRDDSPGLDSVSFTTAAGLNGVVLDDVGVTATRQPDDLLINGGFHDWDSAAPAGWNVLSPGIRKETDLAGSPVGASCTVHTGGTLSQTLAVRPKDFRLKVRFTINLTPGENGWRVPLNLHLHQEGSTQPWISLRLTGNGETGPFALSFYDKEISASDKYVKPAGSTLMAGSAYSVANGFSGPPAIHELVLDYSSASNRYTVSYGPLGGETTVHHDLPFFRTETLADFGGLGELRLQTGSTVNGVVLDDVSVTRRNLLSGLAIDFEHSGAGWQSYILPHWPPTLVPHQWETADPGEGLRSLRIDAGFGVNTFPLPVAPGTVHTLSFLAKGDAQGGRIIINGGNTESGPAQSRVINLTGPEWRRYQTTLTSDDASPDIILLIQNGNPAQSGRPVAIDAVTLVAGEVPDAPPAPDAVSVGLSTGVYGNYFRAGQPVPVEVSLESFLPTEGAPDGWTWQIFDIISGETTPVDEGAPAWAPLNGRRGTYRTTITVPAAQGLYRVLLHPPGRQGDAVPAPTRELIVAQARFAGLPAVSASPENAFLGVHFSHNWTTVADGSGTYQNMQPNQAELLARLRHLGARWLRLHAGRPNLTKLPAVHPTATSIVLYRNEVQRWINAGFAVLGLLEVEWKISARGEPWFDAVSTTGGAWMSTLLPTDQGVWEDYVAATVLGYDGLIRDWEIVNEPNGQMSLDYYLPLLESAKAVIDGLATSQSMRVLGVCPTSDNGTNYSGFLQDALEMDAGDHFDVLSFHPYTALEPDQKGRAMLDQVAGLAALHVPGKPRWISEVGRRTTATYRSHSAMARSPHSLVPALEGAGWVARYMIEARRSGVERYFSYGGARPCFAWQPWEWSPLYEYDGTPAPMFLAMGTAARFLSEASFQNDIPVHADIRAYAFLRSDGKTVVVAWTPAREKEGLLRLSFGSLPNTAWNGAGRALSASTPVTLSRLPAYFVWNAGRSPATPIVSTP